MNGRSTGICSKTSRVSKTKELTFYPQVCLVWSITITLLIYSITDLSGSRRLLSTSPTRTSSRESTPTRPDVARVGGTGLPFRKNVNGFKGHTTSSGVSRVVYYPRVIYPHNGSVDRLNKGWAPESGTTDDDTILEDTSWFSFGVRFQDFRLERPDPPYVVPSRHRTYSFRPRDPSRLLGSQRYRTWTGPLHVTLGTVVLSPTSFPSTPSVTRTGRRSRSSEPLGI